MTSEEAKRFLEDGNRFLEESKYKEAIESYDKALAIDPNLALAWYNRGVELANLGRYQEAVESYDKALAIDPKDASAWFNRGLALGGQEAVENYEEA